MPNEDESLWLVCNGEIYNFQELRNELLARGHRFRSRTDVEVILHLYEEMGDRCVEKLRGMFAFGLWDQHNHRLLLARDRLGKKPLCYASVPGGFVFASEVKALLQDPAVPREVDSKAIWDYLTYQYVPAPMTGFRGISQVLPGHRLIWEDGACRTEPYWTLRYDPKVAMDEEDACARLRELLREAVRVRMVADVPLGVLLSGGIDSSIVALLMSELSEQPIKTFSIGFGDPAFNEAAYARLVAERCGSEHHELVVEAQALDIVPKLAWSYDRPFADSSAIPTYCVSELARRHVTVVLTGDGGDEAFGGYERYTAAMALRWLLRVSPKTLRTWIADHADALRQGSAVGRKAARFAEALRYDDPILGYELWMAHFQGDLKDSICAPDWAEHARDGGVSYLSRTLDGHRAEDFLDSLFYLDNLTYLPNDLLVKLDVASMAHSLEARCPLLDQEVVGFAAALPARWKVGWGGGKRILKRAFRKELPDVIVRRPKKGFGVPLAAWLRGDLREMATDLLTDGSFAGRPFFRASVVRRLLDEHMDGTRDWHYQLWNLLMLELWLRTFIDRPVAGLS